MPEAGVAQDIQSVFGRVGDRKTVQVERCVQDRAAARALAELGNQAMVVRVPVARDDLRSRRAIVRVNRRCQLVNAFGGVEREDHVGSCDLLRVDDVVISALFEHRRRERHPEVAILDHVVDDANDLGLRRIGENGPVAQ